MRACVCTFVRVCARTKQIEVFKYLMAVLIGVCCCVISFLSFSLFQFEIYFFISSANVRTALRCVPVRDAFQARTESKCSACFEADWQLKAHENDVGMEHGCSHVVVGAASAEAALLLFVLLLAGAALLLQVNKHVSFPRCSYGAKFLM